MHTSRAGKPWGQVLFETMFQIQQSTFFIIRIQSPKGQYPGDQARPPPWTSLDPTSLQGVGVKSLHLVLSELCLSHSSALYFLCDLQEVTPLSLTSLICGMNDNSTYYLLGVLLGLIEPTQHAHKVLAQEGSSEVLCANCC